jgi:GTP-binding protein
MEQKNIRNIAIIAHVDHGKTTLVDELFQQSGMFRDNQEVAERLMDSMDLERERGITIVSKNGSFRYADTQVNIIDTPGHADFGGQVERVLRMADGAMLLVDAAEGPMPQTYFVLKKALALSLPVMVVINKVDKPAARPHWAVDQVFDLFGRLDAPDEILDFPVVFASATEGWSSLKEEEKGKDMRPLMDKIVEFFPPPSGDPDGPLQLLVSSVDYSAYSGKLAIGKLTSGSLTMNQEVAITKNGEVAYTTKVSKLFSFVGNEKKPADNVICGDIAALAGMPEIEIGETITDPENPQPLPTIKIDPPTISMTFMANVSPFAGREGKFVTARHIKERLDREVLSDVALHVEDQPGSGGYKVSGRGELQ